MVGVSGDAGIEAKILVGTIGLGRGNLRVAFSEVIEESDMTADAQAIGDDAGLDNITEVTVDRRIKITCICGFS